MCANEGMQSGKNPDNRIDRMIMLLVQLDTRLERSRDHILRRLAAYASHEDARVWLREAGVPV